MGSLVFAFLLASCSGSGGGGDGGGDSTTITGSPGSFTFTATEGGPAPAPQEASISIGGGQVFVGISSNTASAFVGANFVITGTTTGKVTLTPFAPSVVGVGTHTGVVLVRGCVDQGCGRDVSGSPVRLNISYTVQAQTGLKASPQNLNFTQLQGGAAPAAQTLGLSDTTGASYAWNASIVYQQATTGWLTINGAATASGASLPANLSVSINPVTTAGTLTALVRVTGNGNTVDVPVTYSMNEPTLTRSPAQMTFSAASGGATPSAQTVTLSTQNSLPVNYTTNVNYGAGASGWLAVPASGTAPGDVTVGVNTATLAAGSYTATLTFATATQMLSVNVTYTLAASSITFTPGSASFAIGPSSNAAALSQTVALGGAVVNWSAASNQPWVTVSPASGTTGSNVTLNLDPAQLDTLDPGLHSATIMFNFTQPGGGGATSTQLSVSLNLTLPKISWVSPYVTVSGQSRDVILRGKAFNNAAGADLDFGGTSVPASSYTVVSDTEIRVTHPAFAAGAPRRIKFPNSLGNPSIVRSTADLVVVDARAFGAAQSVAYPDSGRTVKRIVYDAERQALLIAVRFPLIDSGAVYRYTFDGSVWSLSNQTPAIGKLNDFALGLDGKKLFLTMNRTQVTPYDPVALTAGTPSSVSFQFLDDFVNQIVMANDGNAVVTRGINGSGTANPFRYSVADATFRELPLCCFGPQAGGSANGSRIVVVQSGVTPAQSAFQYDASSGVFGATSLISSAASPAPALDRNATRILLGGNEVYDSNYQLLGTIPFAPADHVLSPDGTKAYAYESVTIGLVTSGKVHVYDLTPARTPPNSDPFLEIGTGTATPSVPGLENGTRMTISPDGGTLFIAGERGIVVMPAP